VKVDDGDFQPARGLVAASFRREAQARALVLLEALDDARQLAHSHRVCGELCGLEHEWEQALRHLNRAERLLEQTGDTDQLGTVRAERPFIGQAVAGLYCGRPAGR
jgi:hypothetical protein